MLLRFIGWLFGRPGKVTSASADALELGPAQSVDVTAPAAAEDEPELTTVAVSGGSAQLLLAARLASVAALNVRSGRKPKRRAVKPAAKKPVPVARTSAKRQRTATNGPRIARTSNKPSAQIIPFPTVRRQAGARTTRRAA